MKRICLIIIVIFCLCGCTNEDRSMETAISLRQRILSSESSQYICTIVADYGSYLTEFSMQCLYDSDGNMSFTVIKPDTISQISGSIDAQGGKLSFDDRVLMFPLMAEGYLSPVSAPWILMKVLRGGFIQSTVQENDEIHVVIGDTFENRSFQVDVWLDVVGNPRYAEILWEGKRILTVIVTEFICM